MRSRLVWGFAWAMVVAALCFDCLSPASAKLPVGQSVRLAEPTGGFPYVPPPGWHIRTFPGSKCKICYAKPVGGFAPNINVVDEVAAVPLDKYLQINLPQMQRVYHNLHVLGR